MSQLYNIAGSGFLVGAYNWVSDDMRLVLMDDAYVFDATHSISSALSANMVGAPQVIANRAVSADAIATGDEVEFLNLVSSSSVASVVILLWVSDINDATPIAYFDGVAGLPFTPTGGDYTIAINAAFGGYFQLGGASCV